VLLMTRVAPAATVAKLHGYAVTQAPVFETKVKPVGVGSFTTTDCASLEPPFVTVMMKTAFNPGVKLDGAVLTTVKSLEGFTGTLTVLELFALMGSGVLELTLAVLVKLAAA
jgi:hypothetical protein